EEVKRPKVPEGYDDEQQFLQEMRDNYDRGMEADEHNRTAAIQDIEFTYGDQWDEVVRAAREKRRKPVLTVNRLPAYVAQIVNNRLLNETEIRVYPEREGTKEVAELRQGLLRAIFKTRESDFARDEAMKYQVICGVGYFTLTTEYAADEVFDQNIVFKPVVDPLSVVLDPLAVMPCGGDAEYGFVGDNVPRKLFKKKYPWASESDFDTNR
ncbi:portal protein, partial [Arthrospira platensis SPKY1]|nr:portal protein [Arthrospira platensis SPKY1]